MNLEIDYNPTPSKSYFISVSLNEKEAASFDYTSKGHRIIKQVLIDHKTMPKDQTITSEWDALIIENGKFIKRYHVKWVDLNKIDWVNDEVWETVMRKSLSVETKDKLLYYSQLISDNYLKMDSISSEFKAFENILAKEISKFLS
jgi:hypothetical protein